MAISPATLQLIGMGTNVLGSALGGKKQKPEEELLHLPQEMQYEWLQQMMDQMRGGGGPSDAETLNAQKQARDAISQSTWRARRSLMRDYQGAGQAGTPNMQGAMTSWGWLGWARSRARCVT